MDKLTRAITAGFCLMQTQVNNDTTVVIEKQYTSQQMNLQLLMRASKG